MYTAKKQLPDTFSLCLFRLWNTYNYDRYFPYCQSVFETLVIYYELSVAFSEQIVYN